MSKPVLHQLSCSGSRIYNRLFAWLGGIWENKLVKVWKSEVQQAPTAVSDPSISITSLVYSTVYSIWASLLKCLMKLVSVQMVTISPLLKKDQCWCQRNVFSVQRGHAQYTASSAAQHIGRHLCSWLHIFCCWKYTSPIKNNMCAWQYKK